MTNIYEDVDAFRHDPLAFLVERGEKATEPLIPLHLGPDPVYLLTDPDYIKPLLNISEDLVDKGPMIKQIRDVMGDNVVTLSGPTQRPRRAAWHSIVGATTVADFIPLLAAEIREAVAELAKAHTFDARVFGGHMAMRLLCMVAFGAKVLTREEHERLTQDLGIILTDLIQKVFGTDVPANSIAATERLARARQSLDRLVKQVRERTPDSDAARVLRDLQLSETDIANENLTFLIVGHDTTGAATAWLCHILSTVPGLSDLIAAEAAMVRDQNGEIDLAKLASAKTTIATVQEVLRLYPSAYWFPRGTREDIEFAGRKLKKGTAIILSQWLFHRSERFWDAPNEFRLDRSPLRSKAYFPFGAGPRVCVGASFALLELQVMALEICSKLELVPAGPVGAPRALVHLWPPSIPMEARPRPSASRNIGVGPEHLMAAAPHNFPPNIDAAGSSIDGSLYTGCPVHERANVIPNS